ncbi:carbamoyl phosphate synthase small subunit [Alkalicoccus daliensis]|uniref:Carbamoyl phosphate synthase small chain n=1 Tax=Alkalicoccus daliensis TaxID=745820 RepID=A0A1H0AKA8_9BACI|nr:carbamoyl phosphate synthase small subunit [Alkalicoccus daliensis]SDN33825.1 carbamoyl-phosphate synthase small subunit [Alkalicoccus daliensis]
MAAGYLILESGEVFEGEWIGASTAKEGELVFNTAMTGYQEMVTDPSYKGQILTFSYPIIGNYGLNSFSDESARPAVEGVIVNESCAGPSHFQSIHSFDSYLKEHNIPGLAGIDTRALVKIIRKSSTVRAKITKTYHQEEKYTFIKKKKGELVKSVSVQQKKYYSGNGKHVVLLDYGFKESILQALLDEGCAVTTMPYHSSFASVEAEKPDGVLFSNGPGDPMELEKYFGEIKKITETYPSLGICLGHQLIALAHGAASEKMLFGHRGSNHPVLHIPSGKVNITSQNHGYVITDESLKNTEFEPLFININDKSVEGMQHKNLNVSSVQFHPEAHPGPSDTHFIFEEFIQQLSAGGVKECVKI